VSWISMHHVPSYSLLFDISVLADVLSFFGSAFEWMPDVRCQLCV
jgi:hypothetical protein